MILKHNHSFSSSNAPKVMSMQKKLKKQISIQEHTFKHNDSTISDNSKLLTQKTRIRENRQKFHAHFHELIEKRKKVEGMSFRLPKLEVELFVGPKKMLEQKSYDNLQ